MISRELAIVKSYFRAIFILLDPSTKLYEKIILSRDLRVDKIPVTVEFW